MTLTQELLKESAQQLDLIALHRFTLQDQRSRGIKSTIVLRVNESRESHKRVTGHTQHNRLAVDWVRTAVPAQILPGFFSYVAFLSPK